MPQKNAYGIDVSAEEERYLRSAFRRFALPYVLGFAALAWAASALTGSDAGGASTESLAALAQEVEQLRDTVAALEGRLASVDAALEKAGGRVAALEKKAKTAAAPSDSALERALRDASHRMDQLEKTLAEQAAGERLDALAARMTTIEREVRPSLPAAPAPVPTPAPAPNAAPTP